MKSLLTVPKKALIEVKGMSDAKVDKLLEAACKLLPAVQAGAFVTAGEWIVMVRHESSSFSSSPAPAPESSSLLLLLLFVPFRFSSLFSPSSTTLDSLTHTHASSSCLTPQRKDNINIKTGADTLDAILDGGVPTRNLTEIFGEWRYAPRAPTHRKKKEKKNTAVPAVPAVCPLYCSLL